MFFRESDNENMKKSTRHFAAISERRDKVFPRAEECLPMGGE